MADQGCPHEGKDSRLFGRWGCWIQSRLSFHTERAPTDLIAHEQSFHSAFEPVQLVVRFPPYVALIVPIARSEAAPKYFSIRAGFRWDPHWNYHDDSGRTGGYIFPEAIIKVMDHKVL